MSPAVFRSNFRMADSAKCGSPASDRADDIVVVTSPDIPGLRGAQSLLATLHAETEIRARIHVVLNRAGVRGGAAR